MNVEGSPSGRCHDTVLSLNGEVLHHQWDGSHGAGTGLFSVDVLDYLESSSLPVLTANWQSFCLSSLSNDTSKPEIQVLSLTVEGIETLPLTEDVGFTISFASSEAETEVLRLSDAPFDGTPNESTLESWQYPSPSQRPSALEDADPTAQPPLEDLIEQELKKLRKLRKEALALHRAIRAKEDEIRELLNRDCESLFDKWQQCDHDFGCMIDVSIKSVPEIYRSFKYQLISLQGHRYPPACPPHSRTPPANSTRPGDPTKPTPSTPSTATSHPTSPPKNFSEPTKPIDNPPLIIPDIPVKDTPVPFPGHVPVDLPIPSSHKTRDSLRHGLTFLLLIAVSVLLFKIIRRSNVCRRRRVDRRARREERRARRAYESAARRLRWQQWWHGSNYSPRSPSMTSRHSLESLEDAERGDMYHSTQERPSTTESEQGPIDDVETAPVSRQPEQGAMEEEIMGLRRVLEFVGQLVRPEESDPSHSTGSPHEFHRNGNSHVYRDADDGVDGLARSFPENSSGRRTSGLNSPRSSSLVSLETESLITHESLETAPPAYTE